MIWTCRGKYTNPILSDKTIIHGHSPIPESFCKRSIQENAELWRSFVGQSLRRGTLNAERKEPAPSNKHPAPFLKIPPIFL
jgi:hypothetical protein